VLHGYYGTVRTWLLRRMEQWLAGYTDRIITVSQQIRDELVQYQVAPAEKITVVPLGLDLDPFLDCERHRGSFRRELGLADRAQLVGIVGRIFPIKNHRLFLDAMARVSGANPDSHFIIVGDGVLRHDMEAHARALGIAQRTIFTGWRQDLARIYADLDLLVVSSDNEGTPVSAIEAMASATPVVATSVGGLPDLVEDGRTGLLVPPRQPEAMAAAVETLLQDAHLRKRLGQAGRGVAAAKFRSQRLVTEMEALYADLLRSKHPSTL